MVLVLWLQVALVLGCFFSHHWSQQRMSVMKSHLQSVFLNANPQIIHKARLKWVVSPVIANGNYCSSRDLCEHVDLTSSKCQTYMGL